MRCDATQHSITTVKRCALDREAHEQDPTANHRFYADLPRCTNHDRNRDGTSTQQCTKWIGHDGDHRYVEPVHSGTAVCYNTRPYGGVKIGTVERCVRTTRHDSDGCEWPTDADARCTWRAFAVAQEELAKVTEQRDMYSAELAKVREDLRVAVAERDAGQQVAIDRAAHARFLEKRVADLLLDRDEEKRRREAAEAGLADARSKLEALTAKAEAIETNYDQIAATARDALERVNAPIPMLLVCPACGERSRGALHRGTR